VAFTQVQGKTHDVSVAATSGSLGWGDGLAATTPGNDLILIANFNTKTRTLTSVTDAAGNTGWALIDQVNSSTTGSIIAWLLPGKNHVGSLVGTTMVTANFLSSTGLLGLIECSGLDTSAGVDNHTNAGTTSDASAVTSHTMPVLTPVGGDVVLFEAIGMGAASTYTAPTGYTNQVTATHSGSSWAVSSKEIVGGGSQSPVYASGTSANAGKIAFSLKLFIPHIRPVIVGQAVQRASVR
jgi:hypothetical protein